MQDKPIPKEPLIVPKVSNVDFDAGIPTDLLTEISIDQLSWEEFDHLPEVRISLGYDDEAFYLHWKVSEAYFRAAVRAHNELVYEDSCVEFFISLDGKTYYNIEFNALGYGLIGYGDSNKTKRVNLPIEIVEQIDVASSGIVSNGSQVSWDLRLRIPYRVFVHHDFVPQKETQLTANFYKCGDKCERPHFVAWNRVGTAEPNFHQPQFFGSIVLG